MIRNYNDLDVYKKAFEISILVHQKTNDFPKHEQFSLTTQMRRASKYICSYLAEGFVKQQASKADFKRYVLMSIGSATEMLVWTEYAERLNYIEKTDADMWRNGYQEITRMLQSFYNKIEF